MTKAQKLHDNQRSSQTKRLEGIVDIAVGFALASKQ
jgi:hypothetical protein